MLQVIFSQSSELLERESSMASSLEEVSGTPGNEPSGGAPPTDHFGVFKDFDFLEYESESIEVKWYIYIYIYLWQLLFQCLYKMNVYVIYNQIRF